MSASHRSLARLPLAVFSDLVIGPASDGAPDDPADLRSAVCSKLDDFHHRGAVGGSNGPEKSGPAGGATTTVGQLLKLSPSALLRALDPILTNDECGEMMRRICELCAPEPRSALALLRQTVDKSSTPNETGDDPASNEAAHRMRHLPSGVRSLDVCLRGGFRVGTVTELVGRAGVGKSQLAMQLCVMAARYGQGSVFIDTEKKLSLRRLKEIAHERARALNANGPAMNVGDGSFHYHDGVIANSTDGEAVSHSSEQLCAGNDMGYRDPLDVLENVTVHSPGSTQEMLSAVTDVEGEILIRNEEAAALDSGPPKYPVRLVVLDSIAAPARRDFGAESAPQRVSALFQVAQILKRIADQLQVAVVVINQVGQLGESAWGQPARSDTNDADEATDGSDFVSVTAALGTSWHHCVSTRILLEHERDPHRLGTSVDVAQEIATMQGNGDPHQPDRQAWRSERGHVRKATIVKSNVAGQSSMSFEVTVMGVSEMV